MKHKQRDPVVCNQSFPKAMKHEIQFWTKTHGHISLVPSLCMLRLFVPTKIVLQFMFICSFVFKIKYIEREREKNYVYVKERVLYVCLCEKV